MILAFGCAILTCEPFFAAEIGTQSVPKLYKSGKTAGVIRRLPKPHVVYTVAEVARAFGISVSTVHGWLADGKMGFVRAGKKAYRIPHEAVVKKLEQLTAKFLKASKPRQGRPKNVKARGDGTNKKRQGPGGP